VFEYIERFLTNPCNVRKSPQGAYIVRRLTGINAITVKKQPRKHGRLLARSREAPSKQHVSATQQDFEAMTLEESRTTNTGIR